jgi:hypothetical protein
MQTVYACLHTTIVYHNSFPVNFAGGHPGVSPSPFVEAMAARAAANSSVAAFNGSHSSNNNGHRISGNASNSSTSSTPFSGRGAVGGNSRGGVPFSGINAQQVCSCLYYAYLFT